MKVRGTPLFPFALLRFWFGRILLAWALIALMIFLIQLAICGIIHDNQQVKTMLKFLDMMPSIIKSALGGETLQVGNLPALIAIGYQHPLTLLLFMLYAVGIPTGLLAGEVQRGTMELILSRPVTKLQVYLCAALLTVTGMVALVAVMFFGTFVSTRIYNFGEPIPLLEFFRLAVNGGMLSATVGAISLLSAATFSRRGTAVGVAVAYLVANYFVNIIAEWWPQMKSIKTVTIFYYINPHKVFGLHVWPASEMIVLGSLLLTATFLGAIVWNRRDLPL
ncbi:MAG: ABC transporter permease subunit [Phycisphaerae bacterium]|nr:ABC transporter permease subunit [Phycisphaerae bacterium]